MQSNVHILPLRGSRLMPNDEPRRRLCTGPKTVSSRTMASEFSVFIGLFYLLVAVCRIAPIEAGKAECLPVPGLAQRFFRQEGERVNSKYIFHCIEILVGAHQFLIDRKSTRLNSSHQIISYAVF